MNRFHRMAGPAFLGVALVLFGAFHFYPAFKWTHGWRFWVECFDRVVDRQQPLMLPLAPTLAVFATFSAGVVFAPFAAPLIRKSLLTRCFIAFFSGLAGLGLFLVLLAMGPSRMHSGAICLLLSAVCNFAGIVLIPYDGRHQEALRKLSGI
ncbi:hypothetical protein OKA05_20055 [Luteolibacter arcticus]|uniref:Uncharacterized protein n=1 Tax=Luteolibacter arcticus TaxID=1581411 RepID=A0ABT3GMY7_9BACT|nr:hypothetical protein [Luteolibacter arcticus]MCW1924867.1 hypothetical protein [Luteolibacter arcticus]